jgi:hypothetical protein
MQVFRETDRLVLRRFEGDEFGDVEYALDRTGWQRLGGPSAR